MTAALPVVLDASVIVPYNLTDFWLRADQLGFLRVHWSEEILEESERNIARITSAEKAARRVKQMRIAFPSAHCEAPPRGLVDVMSNHVKDRHVLALAVATPDVQTLVTDNLRHFPESAVSPYGIQVMSPDQLIGEMVATAPLGVRAILEHMADGRTRDPSTPRAIIEVLRTKCGIRSAGATLCALATQWVTE